MEKINIAELLKDCPSGMELDCPMYDNVYFNCVLEGSDYPIKIRTPDGLIYLNKYGCCTGHKHAKCVIFPKDKTTWDGFVPPCQFKDGDVVSTENGTWIGITTGGKRGEFIPTYCVIDSDDELNIYFNKKGEWAFSRLSTEQEKAKLFQAIKDNGYKWNAETKTLEKLKKDKFDITTLKPFDKVLVRHTDVGYWKPAFWGRCITSKKFPFITSYGATAQVIPFKGNEWLIGTTDDCDDYYKTW